MMDIYEYDIIADAFSLCREEYNYAYSIEITSEIILDLDSEKNLIGIEFLNASKILNIEPDLLVHPKKIFAEIISTNEGIILAITFDFDNFTRKINAPINTVVSNTNSLVVDA